VKAPEQCCPFAVDGEGFGKHRDRAMIFRSIF
jgi:hypothetical protein